MNWNRVESLLDGALACPPSDRGAYITRGSEGDGALRDEVLSLLQHIDASDRYFAELGHAFAGALTDGGTPADAPGSMQGATVGRYEVGERIGAGGMGEVYRAFDTTLHRDVALKFVPASRTGDPTARNRFYEEARAVAALDHPNVSAVFEVGEAPDGRIFITMPHYGGSTLRELLQERGALPVDDALDYARQIASGLAAAHERGITHCDVKPGNVMIVGGTAKLLDFGIAARRDGPEPAGRVVGTLAYMSPEQIRGEGVGPAADVWSLGVVLYELLSGERPFRAGDRANLAAEVEGVSPTPLARLRSGVPTRITELVDRCLARDPDQRPTTTEVAQLLAPAPIAAHSGASKWKAAIVALVGIGALGLALSGSGSQTTSGVVRLPRPAAGGGWLALAPSDDEMAMVGAGLSPLRMVSLADWSSVPTAGSGLGHTPFYSPDESRVGYTDGVSLLTVPTKGGAPTTLVERLPFPIQGAAWRSDERIIVGSLADGLFEITIASGAPAHFRRVSRPSDDLEEYSHRLPSLLPGSSHALVEVFFGGPGIYPAVVDLESGSVTHLSASGRAPRYDSGHVVYGHFSGLYAVPFDPVTLEETGPHVRLPLVANHRGGNTDFDVAGGRLVLIHPEPRAGELVRVDMDGTEQAIPLEREFVAPRFSPDGRSLLGMSTSGAEQSVWRFDLDTRSMDRMARDHAAFLPQWDADGRTVFYFASGADRREGPSVWQRTWPDGEPTVVVPPPSTLVTVGPAADWVVYHDSERQQTRALQRSSGRDSFLIKGGGEGDISADGRYLALAGTVTAIREVLVFDLLDPTRRVRVTESGGRQPRWSGVGHTLFLRDGRSMVAAQIGTEGELRVVESRALFPDRYDLGARYDVHPGGEGFVMVRATDPDIQVEVIEDWPELLREAVPRTAPSAPLPGRR